MNLGDIAVKVGGKVKGNASIEITDVRSLDNAGKGHITFLTEKKLVDKLKVSKASAVLVDREQNRHSPGGYPQSHAGVCPFNGALSP